MTSFLRASLFAVLALGACDVGDINNGPQPGQPDAGGNNNLPDGSATPKLSIASNKTAIMTEVNGSEQVAITATGEGGFSGNVTFAVQVLDATTNAPVTGVTATLSQPSVTLPANGTANTVATIAVGPKAPTVGLKLKVTATSSLGMAELATVPTLTVLNQYTMTITAAGDQCVYPTLPAGTAVAIGTKVRFVNATGTPMVTHIDGPPGTRHQDDPGSINGAAYEQSPSAVGTITWWCHSLNGVGKPPANNRVMVVAQ